MRKMTFRNIPTMPCPLCRRAGIPDDGELWCQYCRVWFDSEGVTGEAGGWANSNSSLAWLLGAFLFGLPLFGLWKLDLIHLLWQKPFGMWFSITFGVALVGALLAPALGRLGRGAIAILGLAPVASLIVLMFAMMGNAG